VRETAPSQSHNNVQGGTKAHVDMAAMELMNKEQKGPVVLGNVRSQAGKETKN